MEKLKCLWAFVKFLWSGKQTSFVREVNKNGHCYIINSYQCQSTKEFIEKLDKELNEELEKIRKDKFYWHMYTKRN